ncbi:glycosyltransferase family 4 protein [Sphingomonas sinipercae]|uniref:glycosyltransferase family 4 protein n=1 Tax=Sphingomonas sinipercae TaxID=2714944 RepID=UPI003CCE4489
MDRKLKSPAATIESRAIPQQDPPLLALSANSAWNLVNFRTPLLQSLQATGYRLAALVPDGDDVRPLSDLGVEVVPIAMSPRGISPLSDARLTYAYWRALRRLSPQAFLGFTPKPNIYGSLAARAAGVPVINNITGLGTGFLSGRMLERLVSGLYKAALHGSRRVFFHNPDDLALFVERRLVTPEQAEVIPGSGIDLDAFAPAPPRSGDGVVFLFVGRMLIDKGIVEFAEAARQVRRQIPDTRFVVVGGWSPHPKAASAEQIDGWKAEAILEFHGNRDDVRSFVEASDCVVLPSYREGLPRALLEASALARPLIAADVPGCRHLVEEGDNGFMCTVRSADALAEAMVRFARLPEEERNQMGRRARTNAEERFGHDRVTDAYIRALEPLSSQLTSV